MDFKLFQEVNDKLSGRFSASLFVCAMLSVLVVLQQIYIMEREEVVIDRPMFNDDKELRYVRDKVTESVALTWAYNAVMIYGNISPESYSFAKTMSNSLLGSNVAEALDTSHKRQVLEMDRQKVSIRFIPEEAVYDPKTNVVTISGIRRVEKLSRRLSEEDRKPMDEKYRYQLTIAVMGFRPYVDEWSEGRL